MRGLVRRVLLNDNNAFLRTRGVVAVEYRPENRAPDLRLKNGLGDGDAAADELSGYSSNTLYINTVCMIYSCTSKLKEHFGTY